MPKQGHQGLTGAKVITFLETANQFEIIIWRTIQKDEITIKENKLFAHLKSADLWRWKVEKVPIYGVRELKKCRFMALES